MLSFLAYHPTAHCIPSLSGHPPPNATLCAEITDGMEASPKTYVFGPARLKLPGVEVTLPRSINLISPEGSCELIINIKGATDTASWFDIYASAKALETICVQKGEGGISGGQGAEGNLFIIIRGGSEGSRTSQE